MPTISIYGGLYLLRDGSCVSLNGVLPRRLWDSGGETKCRSREALWIGVLTCIMELVDINVMVDLTCLLSSDGADESPFDPTEQTDGGDVHFVEERVFATYCGRSVLEVEDRVWG